MFDIGYLCYDFNWQFDAISGVANLICDAIYYFSINVSRSTINWGDVSFLRRRRNFWTFQDQPLRRNLRVLKKFSWDYLGIILNNFISQLCCINAFTSNIHKLAVNTKFEISARRILKSRLPRLSAAVRKSVGKRHDTRQLCEDLRNIPYHVFGNHEKCRDEYCTRKTNKEENYIPLLQTSVLFEKICKVVDNVVRKANRLSRNVTTNYAERYMSLVATFSGGKRINYILRGSYQRRCYGAALSFNSGPSWHIHSLPSFNETHSNQVFFILFIIII